MPGRVLDIENNTIVVDCSCCLKKKKKHGIQKEDDSQGEKKEEGKDHSVAKHTEIPASIIEVSTDKEFRENQENYVGDGFVEEGSARDLQGPPRSDYYTSKNPRRKGSKKLGPFQSVGQ